MIIRKYREADLDDMIAIWNEVVKAGAEKWKAFPQNNNGGAFYCVAAFSFCYRL